ncbi:unnamed protein product [Ectocarpus sp. CCAP 1310/34]|nr:unnamed protein product [Ectocarpus sp. CCAP 1310/34]
MEQTTRFQKLAAPIRGAKDKARVDILVKEDEEDEEEEEEEEEEDYEEEKVG